MKDVLQAALADKPATPFRTPPGLNMVRVDATTGKLADSGDAVVITEPFIPGTEPGQNRSAEHEPDDPTADPFARPRPSRQVVPPSSNGIY